LKFGDTNPPKTSFFVKYTYGDVFVLLASHLNADLYSSPGTKGKKRLSVCKEPYVQAGACL
jgi:hypothetical protein